MDQNNTNPFVGYEYKEILVPADKASFYLDCYENFGWQVDGNIPAQNLHSQMKLCMKRDRKIINRMELTRLQRHFEACAKEIETLENSKTNAAVIKSLIVGIFGTAFMAGSTFAVTYEPPMVILCILLAIPGFVGWILPCFIYKSKKKNKTQKVQPHIEEKYDEIYEKCEKGHSLL